MATPQRRGTSSEASRSRRVPSTHSVTSTLLLDSSAPPSAPSRIEPAPLRGAELRCSTPRPRSPPPPLVTALKW